MFIIHHLITCKVGLKLLRGVDGHVAHLAADVRGHRARVGIGGVIVVVSHAAGSAAVADDLPGVSLRRDDPRVAGSSLMMTIGWNCIGDPGRGLHIGLLLLMLVVLLMLMLSQMLARVIDALQALRPSLEIMLLLLLLLVLIPHCRVLVLA